MHTESKNVKLRLAHMEKKVSEYAANDGVNLDQELHSNIKQIITDCTDQVDHTYQSDTFEHLFWEQQKKASSLQDSRSMKWHPLVIKWCLYFE